MDEKFMDSFYSYPLDGFSETEQAMENFDLLSKNYVAERLEYRVTLPKEYHPILEIDEWVIENVTCRWGCGYFQSSCTQTEYSFDDLATATLFRLRF